MENIEKNLDWIERREAVFLVGFRGSCRKGRRIVGNRGVNGVGEVEMRDFGWDFEVGIEGRVGGEFDGDFLRGFLRGV